MKRLALTVLIPVLGVLAACSGSERVEPDDAAADFAARIKGNDAPAPAAEQPGEPTAMAPMSEPTMVPPRPIPPPDAAPVAGAAPGSPPSPARCNADRMGPFLGRQADEATRLAVMAAAEGASDVRFVDAGSEFIPPDPANPRLNMMLDARGIIRDAKCG